MANKEISGDNGLDLAGPLTGAETLHIVQGGNSVQVDLDTLKAFFNDAVQPVSGEDPWRGATYSLPSDHLVFDTGATGEVGTYISWQGVGGGGVDTEGFWSGAAPTRMTIQPGITRAALQFKGFYETDESATGDMSGKSITARIVKNQDEVNGILAEQTLLTDANGRVDFDLSVAEMDVQPYDFFEVWVRHQAGTNGWLRDTVQTFFNCDVKEVRA